MGRRPHNRFQGHVSSLQPAQGWSFLPTPREIAIKKAVVNVQNYNDELCFLYSILAALHPVQHGQNPFRVSHYKPYQSELDTTGLSFPLSVRDVSKFESLNADIAVNVTTFDEQQPIPLYVSPHKDRKHTIHLFLLADENMQHYTLVKNLSRLVHGRTKHDGRMFICSYCLHCVSKEHVLNTHIPNCCNHAPQTTTYPKPEDAVLSYKAIQKEFPVPYVLYVDFLTFLTSSADKDTVSQHVVSVSVAQKLTMKYSNLLFTAEQTFSQNFTNTFLRNKRPYVQSSTLKRTLFH